MVRRSSSWFGRVRRKWKRTFKTVSTNVHNLIAGVAAWLTAIALALVLFSLHIIGPVPRIHIDALWVQDHKPQVTFAIASMGLAVGATIFAVCYKRNRWRMLVLWIGAMTIASLAFSNRIDVIWRVVTEHMLS